MGWDSYFGLLILCAIIGIPFYHLETIKYKQYYEQCWEDWNKAQEFSELHICRDPSMRDRYRKYIKCEETKRSLIISPKDCALQTWWDQFLPVKAYGSLHVAVAGTWYIYMLSAVLCVVFVWTWVRSRSNLQDRREQRDHEHRLLSEWGDRFEDRVRGGHIGGRRLSAPARNQYAMQKRYDARHSMRLDGAY